MQSNQATYNKDAQRAFSTYGDMVYRLALVRTCQQSDAEDIVQEVFLRYLRSAPQTMEGEHEKAWLIRVTINATKSLATSAWRRKTEPLPDEVVAPPGSAFPGDEEPSEIYEAVMALGDPYRSAVHLFYYEGYKTAEIAGMMDANDTTVRSWLHRAREMLREALQDTFDEQDEE